MPSHPTTSREFPIEEGLSPPIVAAPIHECAESVHVSGYVPGATIDVYSNGVDHLAQEVTVFAFGDLVLSRRLAKGEKISATQTVDGVTSAQSTHPVTVGPLAAGDVSSTKPVVGKEIYECGVVVPVGSLIQSTRVLIDENSVQVGSAPVAGTWKAVFTSPLHSGAAVTASMVACEGTDTEVRSPRSDPVIVKPAPVPPPAPKVDANSLIPGNDVVTLTGLYVGARIEIQDQGNVVTSGWYATGSDNYFPVDPPLTASSVITATQELCGNVSNPSDPAEPSGKLLAPQVLAPICEDARYVVLRKTTPNAVIVVFRNGNVVGYGGAAPGDVVLALAPGANLQAGDNISSLQYVGNTFSPLSNVVTVVGGLEEPTVEIVGGHPFFVGAPGEKEIDAPVFPRGEGTVTVNVHTCCDGDTTVDIFGPGRDLVASLTATEVFPGFYRAIWDWTMRSGAAVPDEVPVGRYSVVARSECHRADGSGSFYVIFDPDDVNGPPRFSFNSTGVWFGTRTNSAWALLYHLHPSDARVFDIALAAASGETDSRKAAKKICTAEEQLFSYSLNYHTDDVVKLLTQFNSAQCADDSAMLTGLLRAVGIPAHPVTADAGLETGAANWRFDTWVELLVPNPSQPEWLVLHPHEYPGMQPETRAVFGQRGVANKGFNDLIFMAGANWPWDAASDSANDVSYSRNSCGEPVQNITKASWVEELCEAGYWPIPHWDCGGVGSRTSGLTAIDGIRLRSGAELRFGGLVLGEVVLANEGEWRMFGTVTAELISDDPRSKQFGDEIFAESVHSVRLDHDGRTLVQFGFEMPRTLPPGRDLYVRVRYDERTVAIEPVALRPSIEVRVEMDAAPRLGERMRIRAVLANRGRNVIEEMEVDLELPFALELARGLRHQRLGGLDGGGTREVEWVVASIAPLEAGIVRISVATSNAGGDVATVPVHVEAPPAPVIGEPATRIEG